MSDRPLPDDAPGPAWWRDDVPVDGLTAPLDPPGDRRPAGPDVLVVGLGNSGLEAVAWLAERGEDVWGVDAHGIAAGAAGANGGFVLAGVADFHHDAVQRHGRAAANAWWHATVEEMDRLADEEPTFRRVGSLRIAADEVEERDCLIHLAQMRRDGLDATAYDGPEGRGLIMPGDGVLHPVARARRLADRAVAAGARLHAPVRVVEVRGGTGVGAARRPTVVLTCGAPGVENTASDDASGGASGGAPEGSADGAQDGSAERVVEVRPRRVLVAVDGGLEHVLPDLAGQVRTARLQMLATAPLPPPLLPRPVYRRHGRDYFHQRPTGEVLLGGGRDVGGDAEWDAPAVPSDLVQQHLDRLRDELGLGDAAVSSRWAARAAFTTSRLPVDVLAHPHVRAVGGYSGHGNVIGGMLARRAASLLVR